MSDELNPNDTAPPPQADVAAQPAANATTLTAEQVKAMIDEATQKAFNSGAAAARREEKAKQTKPNTPPPAPNEATQSNTQQSAAIDGFALSESLAEFTLTKEQRRTIRDLASKENPDNLDEFVAKWAGLFGAKPASASAAQSTSNANNATAGQPPASQPAKGPALPAPAPTADRELDTIFRSMPEDAARDTWQAYVRRTGANPANPYDPRNRAAWREMRKRFEAQVATASIQLGARR